MEVDFSALEQPHDITGVGGSLGVHYEGSILVFDDGIRSLPIPIHLGIAGRGSSRFPSLLGRDILDQARTVIDPAGGELSLDFGTGLAW